MFKDKSILLVIGGGVAAYKSLDFIRRLKEQGATVRAILTKSGAEFITPLSVASLSGEKVYTDLFNLKDESEMGHIRLSREADLIIVAPATANLIAKLAEGRADDLASTTLLASDKPILLAPSMNVEMWEKPATKRNIARLEADGLLRVGPGAGMLACGEEGEGRLAEIDDIVAAAARALGVGDLPLRGKRALVTAGPTHEAIDPVRYIANRSSGKQGYAIAAALYALGAETHLISGPTNLRTPRGVERHDVQSAREMCDATLGLLPADIAVCVAAVADWRPKDTATQKIKKNGKVPALEMVENPDILATLSARGNDRPALVVGFAAETENHTEHAMAKLSKKGCDWVIANDVSPEGGVMGGDETALTLVTADGAEPMGTLSKAASAALLADRIAETLKDQ